MRSSIKFNSALKELRIHLCSTSESSKGVREFIQQYYVDIKKTNPKTPVLIRECSAILPKLWARFSGGREVSISLKDMKSEEILDRLSTITSDKDQDIVCELSKIKAWQ